MPIDRPPTLVFPPALIRRAESKEQAACQYLIARAKIPRSGAQPSQVPRFIPELLTTLQKSQQRYLPMKTMSLPPKGLWTQPFEETPQDYNYRLELGPKGDLDTTLAISSDGYPCLETDPVRNLLQQPPHTLSHAERDLFRPQIPMTAKAYTTVFNGKLVFVLEKENKGVKTYRMEFNHNPDGTVPIIWAVIRFDAPTRKYNKYIASIKKCLSTIVWIDKIDIPVPAVSSEQNTAK